MKLKIDHFGFLAGSYERLIPVQVPETLLALLELPEDGKVLDAGGGTGRIAQFYAQGSALAVVADPSLKMLYEARKKYGVRCLRSPAEQLPFPDGAFDRVTMVDAFHHVQDQPRVAAELWRVLRVGGKLVIEEPDYRTFSVKLIALGEILLLMGSHFLTPEQIAALFPEAKNRIMTLDATAWVVIDK
jgi:ubiquinone/menaquinone biosynthesis C-methylase UbiE